MNLVLSFIYALIAAVLADLLWAHLVTPALVEVLPRVGEFTLGVAVLVFALVFFGYVSWDKRRV